jgi:hypothetical protein
MTRAERADVVKAMVDEGYTARQISSRLELSRSYVRDLINDPAGSKTVARKNRYRRLCPGYGERAGRCGTLMDGSNGNGPSRSTLCVECAKLRHRAEFSWQPDEVITVFQEFHRRTGRVPAATDAMGRSPSVRRNMSAVRRAEFDDSACLLLPPPATVKSLFGSWGEAVRAAGYEPLRSGGRGHRALQQRGFVADMILDVLADGPALISDIEALTGRDIGAIRAQVRLLFLRGTVTRRRVPGRRIQYVYTLTPEREPS